MQCPHQHSETNVCAGLYKGLKQWSHDVYQGRGAHTHSPIWQEDTSTLPLRRSPRGLFSVACWARVESRERTGVKVGAQSASDTTQQQQTQTHASDTNALDSQIGRAPRPSGWFPPRNSQGTTVASYRRSLPSTCVDNTNTQTLVFRLHVAFVNQIKTETEKQAPKTNTQNR